MNRSSTSYNLVGILLTILTTYIGIQFKNVMDGIHLNILLHIKILLLRVIYVNESDESSDHRGTVWEVT